MMSVEAVEPVYIACLQQLPVAFRKLRKSQRAEAEQPEDIRGTQENLLTIKYDSVSLKSLIVVVVSNVRL